MDLAICNQAVAPNALGFLSRKVVIGGYVMPEVFNIISQSNNTFVIGASGAAAFNTFLNAQLALGPVYVATVDGSNNSLVFTVASSSYSSGTSEVTIIVSGPVPVQSYTGLAMYFTKLFNPATDTCAASEDHLGTAVACDWPVSYGWPAASINTATLTLTGSGEFDCYGNVGAYNSSGELLAGAFLGAGQDFYLRPGSQVLLDMQYNDLYCSITGCVIHNFSGTSGEILAGILGGKNPGDVVNPNSAFPLKNHVANAMFQVLYTPPD